MWFDIGDAKAIKKTGQALREDAPEIRPEIDGESSGDEKNASGDEAKKSPVKSPKSPKDNNNSKPRKSKSPKAQQTNTSPAYTSPASSPKAAIPQDFNAHGPQLLPGAWPNASGKDQQERAAMPPPFQNNQQANPYMMPEGQAQVQNSFEPRIIPIQAPKNLYNMPNQFFSGGRSVSSRASNTSRHAQEVLAHSGANIYHQRMQAAEDRAFGRSFHPPASAIGSERTASTISGLTDPFLSNISSQTGSGMHGIGNNFNAGIFFPGPQQRQTGARGSLRFNQVFPSHDFGASDLGLSRSQTSDMNASFRMQTSVRMGSDMSSFNGSITRSSSFPDMSSIVDIDSWNNAIAESDEDMPVLRSILSSSNSRASHHTSGASMMSIGSGTSSSQWMNASFDGRSILSEMSSDLDALDLAS
jgi:hypothetical protein